MFDFQEELKKLPTSPGVYIMRDESETVIYVGKAINLKNRVRNYFQPANRFIPKIRNILANINMFEYIVTDTEMEALILECNLIKKYSPKYNVLLKDDKSYPYIKMTGKEDFSRVFVTHSSEKDGSKYFGPYTSGFAVSEIMALIETIWQLRNCTKNIEEGVKTGRPCLNHHIGRCKAPCTGEVKKEDYALIVNEVEDFLNGRHNDILKRLEKEMFKASEELMFEKAAELRDKIKAIHKITERQKLDTITGGDQDVIAFAKNVDEALVQVFFFRAGKMTGREHFMLNGVEAMTDEAIMTEFITRFYSGTPFIPKEMILQWDIEDRELITEWLTSEKKAKVSLNVPQKGEKFKLVQLAKQNAEITLTQFGEQIKREKQRTEGALAEISKALGLEIFLERIEAYDISNIQGYESVGSMVVFENGKQKNSDYRKFKIKSVKGANDYASMHEVILRRFLRYKKEAVENVSAGKAKFSKLPSILFIDGGKPQISAAQAAISEVGIEIPVCGMVKDDKHRTKGILFNDDEISLPYTSEGFKLLTRIQDEVHRFAVEYHRKLRSNTQVRSVLDEIKGIGGARRRALLRHFGSVEKIKEAEIVDLAAVEGMTAPAAESVYSFFHAID